MVGHRHLQVEVLMELEEVVNLSPYLRHPPESPFLVMEVIHLVHLARPATRVPTCLGHG